MPMRKYLPFASGSLLVTLALAGCGGGSGSGSCSGLAACGGVIEGTWAIDSMCIAGDVLGAMSSSMGLPSACSGVLKSFSFENPSGTLTYAGGNETANLSIGMRMEMAYNSACASAMAGTTITVDATICAAMQQQLQSDPTYSSATCSFSNGACDCVVKSQNTSTGVTGYTTSGSTIQYTDGSDPADYCVSDPKLTERQVSPDFGNLTMIANFHRQ
jgi:hypothetical protein